MICGPIFKKHSVLSKNECILKKIFKIGIACYVIHFKKLTPCKIDCQRHTYYFCRHLLLTLNENMFNRKKVYLQLYYV